MSNSASQDIDRLTSTVSGLIKLQTREVSGEVDKLKVAVEQASERISKAMHPGTPPKPTGHGHSSGGAATPAPSPSTPLSSATGVLLVQVVNDASQPVPVTVIKEEKGGLLGSILGGAGSFLGGLIGGIAAGISAPVVVGELIVLAGELIALAPMIIKIVNIAERIIDKVRSLVSEALVFIDVGVRAILGYLEPLINWVGQLVKSVLGWVGGLLNGVASLVEDLFNKLPGYLDKLIPVLLDSALGWVKGKLHSLIDTLIDKLRGLYEGVIKTLYGLPLGLGNVIIAAGKYVFDLFLAGLTSVLSTVLAKVGISFTPTPAPAKAPDFKAEFTAGMKSGEMLAKAMSSVIFGAPHTHKAPGGKGGNLSEALTGEGDKGAKPPGYPTLDLAPFKKPAFEPPEYKAPVRSLLPGLLEATEFKKKQEGTLPRSVLPFKSELPPEARPRAEAQPLVINGGITVNINGAQIDGPNAGKTARAIAENIMDELRRMSEVERFRRGLPTGSVG